MAARPKLKLNRGDLQLALDYLQDVSDRDDNVAELCNKIREILR